MVTNPDHASILYLYGQTGVGKSSILAAGLIPRLKNSHAVQYQRHNGETSLIELLARGLSFKQPKAADIQSIQQAWMWHEQKTGKPLLLVLDQVEEIFARQSPEEIAQGLTEFMEVLRELFTGSEDRPLGKCLLGFRKEWLPDIEAASKEARLFVSKFFLKRLDRKGTIEAIEGVPNSARLQARYRLGIEEGLAELIADDLLEDRESPLAPTLQILLTKMWYEVSEKAMVEPFFDARHYHQLKRRGILLSDFLDEQLHVMHRWNKDASESGLVLDILARHVTSLGTGDTCLVQELYADYTHQVRQIPELLKQLQQLYLIVPVEHEVNGQIVKATRLAHDTLAPLIQHLFRASDRPGQRALRILENRGIEWVYGQVGAPLDETDLKLVENGQNGMHVWTPDEQRLVGASRKARARRQRRRTWSRVGAMVAVGLITLFAIAAGISRQQAANSAEEERLARELAEENEQLAVDAQQLAEENEREAQRQAEIALANEEGGPAASWNCTGKRGRSRSAAE